MMMQADWDRWNAIPLPSNGRLNDWGEPYSEIYEWYPWMRKFYTAWEIETDCISVSSELSLFVFCCRSYIQQRDRNAMMHVCNFCFLLII